MAGIMASSTTKNRPSRTGKKRKMCNDSESKVRTRTDNVLPISSSNDRPNSSVNETNASNFEEHPYSLSLPKKKRISNVCPSWTKYIDESCLTDPTGTKLKCSSKSAVFARINRLKKKRYIEELETKNTLLEAENETLKDTLDRRLHEIASLHREVANLRNVIRNSTEIGTLLKCIHQNTNLRISSSLMKEMSGNTEPDNSNRLLGLDVTRLRPSIVPGANEKVLVAAILWGMALHTICQPYKQTSPHQ